MNPEEFGDTMNQIESFEYYKVQVSKKVKLVSIKLERVSFSLVGTSPKSKI